MDRVAWIGSAGSSSGALAQPFCVPPPSTPLPRRGSKPRPRKADASTRGEDDSGDEAVAFTEADLVEDEADAARCARMLESDLGEGITRWCILGPIHHI